MLAVHDNGSNMVSAANKSNFIQTSVRCVCHTLQLAIRDAFKDCGMDNALEKCKKLAAVVHYSSQAQQALKKECERHEGITYRKLISPVATRWNSEAMCMESILNVKPAIINLCATNEAFSGKGPTVSEWNLLEGGVFLLKELQKVSELWSGDKYPTSLEVVPALFNLCGKRGLLREFTKPQGNRGKGKMFANALLKALEERFPRYGTDTEVFAMASFLDPRYMGLALKEDNGPYNDIKEKLGDMAKELLATEAAFNMSMGSNDSSDSQVQGPTALERLLRKTTSSQDLTCPGQAEVNSYTCMVKIPPTCNGGKVLEWWKANSESLPGLSKLARKYLGVPASSATSERMFSVGSGTCSKIRTSLDPEHLSALVYLNTNQKILRENKPDL